MPAFKFKILKTYRDCLSRQLGEAISIWSSRDVLLNSKNEYITNCISRITVEEGTIERRMRENRELEEEQAALLALHKFRDMKTSSHQEDNKETPSSETIVDDELPDTSKSKERRGKHDQGHERGKDIPKKRKLENKENITMLRERMDRERNAIREWMDRKRIKTELTQNKKSPTLDNRLGGVKMNTPKRKFENEPFNGEVNLETFLIQSPAKKRRVQAFEDKMKYWSLIEKNSQDYSSTHTSLGQQGLSLIDRKEDIASDDLT